jgi:peptidoglycan/LPS O-acetylase OafA/YrhL
MKGSFKHLPALDGLRGIAVVLVIWFHLGGSFGTRMVGGYLGVDVFFVLSGFLITSVLLAEHARHGTIDFRAFWFRRARRLLPALLALMPAVAAYALTFAQQSELRTLRLDALATLGYLANWRAIFTSKNYWEMFAAPSPLEHTWSLAIEEQFYLLWPLVFVLCVVRMRMVRSARVATCWVLGGLSSLAMALLFDPENTARAYFGTDTRAGGILFGAGLAFALEGLALTRFTRTLDALGSLCLVFLWLVVTKLPGHSVRLYRGGFVLTELACCVLIACATLGRRSLVSRALGTKPLTWLGTISYGIYLWHWPIFCVLTQERLHASEVRVTLLRLAATLGVSIASYVCLEAPIRARGLGFANKTPTKPVLATMGAVGVAVALIVACTHVRFNDRQGLGGQLAHRTAPISVPTSVQSRGTEGKNADAGVVAPGRFSVHDNVLPEAKDLPPGTKRILVLGDSVAIALGMVMRQNQHLAPVFVSERGVGNCSLMESQTFRRGTPIGHPAPTAWNCGKNWVTDVAELRPEITLIALGGAFYKRLMVDGRYETACGAGWQEAYRARLDQLLSEMRLNAGRVAIILAPYPGPQRVTGSMLEDVDCLNELFRSFAREHQIQVVDVAKQVCPTRQCPVLSEDGQVIRPDGLHPEGPGAAPLALWTIRELLNYAP